MPETTPAPQSGLPSPKKRGHYRPKNQLDGLLRFAIGGKYKWRRYAILRDYLQVCHEYSKEKADDTITQLQANGTSNPLSLQEGLKDWMKRRRKEQASKAAKAKSKKYRKWSPKRRRAWRLKKFGRA
jgi:hypothetical protein